MADETTAANRKWKLIFIAIHGLGPQKKEMRVEFLREVKAVFADELPELTANNYIDLTPDWSHDFRNASDNWLYSQVYDDLNWNEFNAGIKDSSTRELLHKIKSAEDRIDFPTLREYYIGAKGGADFATLGPGVPPDEVDDTPRGKVNETIKKLSGSGSCKGIKDKFDSILNAIGDWFRKAARSVIIQIIIWLIAILILHQIICSLGLCHIPSALIDILIALLLYYLGKYKLPKFLRGLISVKKALPELKKIGETFPWNNLFGIGRPFEAHSISDIMLYSSPAPRFRILSTIIDSLQEEIDGTEPDTDIYLVLGGHSLGSVIAYDLLRAWIVLSNRDGTVVRGIQDETKPILVDGFREKAAGIVDRVQPIGLVTFGSPVSLFMFRKPDLFSRLDLWNELCPARYRDSQGFNPVDPATDLQWRWMNFWHASDFVAHKLGPFFNTSAVTGNRLFVEDIETSKETPEPISAHSTYWIDGQVHREIGGYLKDCLTKLGRHHGAGS